MCNVGMYCICVEFLRIAVIKKRYGYRLLDKFPVFEQVGEKIPTVKVGHASNKL